MLDLIVSNELPVLHTQTLATLGTACGQNSATTLGRHAGAEAVALRTLTVVRLISTFHVSTLPGKKCNFEIVTPDFIKSTSNFSFLAFLPLGGNGGYQRDSEGMNAGSWLL